MQILQLKSFLKYIISISLLLFLLAQMDFGVLMHKSESLNYWLLGLSLMFVICQIFCLNMRWHSYLNTSGHRVSFRTSSLINIAGYFANILFITSVGGILAKSGLAVRQGLSVTQAVFVTFLDRFMTLAALVVFSLFGMVFLFDILDHKLFFMLAVCVCGTAVIVPIFLIAVHSGIVEDLTFLCGKRSDLILVLKNYTGDFDLMLKTSLYSLLAQGFFIFSVYVLSLNIDNAALHISMVEFLALMPVLALISSLPISFGGWGVREGAFIYGLGLIGFPMESAFFLSVQVGVVTLIAPFIVGLPYLWNADLRQVLREDARQSGAL